MGMRLAKPCPCDSDEAGFISQKVNCWCTAIAHARSQTAQQLIQGVVDRSLQGNATIDTLRNQLEPGILKVPVAAPLLHCAKRSHAAVGLVLSVPCRDDVARTFDSGGEKAAEHDRVASGCKSFCYVARVPDASVGDNRNVMTLGLLGALVDGGYLGHTNSCYDTRRTDRPWTYADLHLSLIHISEPTRLGMISYAVFC